MTINKSVDFQLGGSLNESVDFQLSSSLIERTHCEKMLENLMMNSFFNAQFKACARYFLSNFHFLTK